MDPYLTASWLIGNTVAALFLYRETRKAFLRGNVKAHETLSVISLGLWLMPILIFSLAK